MRSYTVIHIGVHMIIRYLKFTQSLAFLYMFEMATLRFSAIVPLVNQFLS